MRPIPSVPKSAAPAAVRWGVGLVLIGAACGAGKPQNPSETTGSGSSNDSASTTTSMDTTDSSSQAMQQPTTSSEGSSDCGSARTDPSQTGGFTSGTADLAAPSKDCNQFLQDCPAGQKCAPASLDGDSVWDALICVPVVPDPAQTGEPCTVGDVSGEDNCDIGNFCWHIDPDTGEGFCVAQCEGSPDIPQCAEGTACAIGGDGIFTPCLSLCDPLAPDCPDELECYAGSFNAVVHFACLRDESGDEGQTFDSCLSTNGCDPGHACVLWVVAEECDPMASGCCLPFCDLSLPPTCAGVGAQCVPWFEEGQAPAGLENVGVCALPE